MALITVAAAVGIGAKLRDVQQRLGLTNGDLVEHGDCVALQWALDRGQDREDPSIRTDYEKCRERLTGCPAGKECVRPAPPPGPLDGLARCAGEFWKGLQGRPCGRGLLRAEVDWSHPDIERCAREALANTSCREAGVRTGETGRLAKYLLEIITMGRRPPGAPPGTPGGRVTTSVSHGRALPPGKVNTAADPYAENCVLCSVGGISGRTSTRVASAARRVEDVVPLEQIDDVVRQNGLRTVYRKQYRVSRWDDKAGDAVRGEDWQELARTLDTAPDGVQTIWVESSPYTGQGHAMVVKKVRGKIQLWDYQVRSDRPIVTYDNAEGLLNRTNRGGYPLVDIWVVE
jgi:hypothetical protein